MMAQVYTKITLAATGSNPVDRLLAAGLTPTGNPDQQVIGSWARYLGLGTQAEADDEQKT